MTHVAFMFCFYVKHCILFKKKSFTSKVKTIKNGYMNLKIFCTVIIQLTFILFKQVHIHDIIHGVVM